MVRGRPEKEKSLLWGSYLIILMVVLYPPFAFVNIINPLYRVIFFSVITLVLLYKSKLKLIKIFLLLLFFLVNVLTSIFSIAEDFGIRTLLSTISILLFGILFNSITENNNRFFKVFLREFSRFIDILAFATIMGFIWAQLNFSEINIFGIPSLANNPGAYNYTFTPFGMTFPKEPFGINTYRGFSYFIEPVYAAPFFAINGLIFKDRRSNVAAILNFVAGILTISYLYILITSVILIMKLKYKNRILCTTLFILAYFAIIEYSILGHNSFSERLSRANIFIQIFSTTDLVNILLGHGYGMGDYGFQKGISAGLLINILENGLIGFLIFLLIIIYQFGKNLEVFIISIIMWLTFEVFKFPAFWVLLICMKVKLNYPKLSFNITKINK